MNPIDRATILYYHRHRMAAFGECSLKSLGWRGEDSQRRRFEVIADAGEFSGCSVLDVGCGRGDLKRFLDTRFSQFAYIGLDHMPEFIAQAREAYAGVAQTWFLECDFSAVKWPQVDYVVASGALGYRTSDAAFRFNMVQKMYDSAQCAAIFNVLDAKVFAGDAQLVGCDTDELLALCERIAPGVRVFRGYLEDDVTICLDRTLPAAGK